MKPPKTGIEIAETASNEKKYFETLARIAVGYASAAKLKQTAKIMGVSYLENLEMAYENIQEDAKSAIKGRRK